MSGVTVRVGLLLAPYAFIVFGLRTRERVASRGHRRRYSLTRLGRVHYRTVQPYGPEWHEMGSRSSGDGHSSERRKSRDEGGHFGTICITRTVAAAS
jgi:hypothetical protein